MKRGDPKNANGLFNIDFDTGIPPEIDDDNDSDLEAELLALTGNDAPKKKIKKKVPPQENIDALVAASMKDVPSDDDVSVDENDEELLGELSEITGGVQETEETNNGDETSPQSELLELLQKRLAMYEEVERQAKEAGETSKARRYGRGKDALHDFIKQAKSGQTVNVNDIPPEVKFIKSKPAQIVQQVEPEIKSTEPEPHSSNESTHEQEPEKVSNVQIDEELLNTLKTRSMQYKKAALKAKKSGDVQTAVNYLKISKQFETVMEAYRNGEPVDLSQMPQAPSEPVEHPVEKQEVQMSVEPEPESKQATETSSPVSLPEALKQCIEFYKKQEEKAKSEENASKARRMGRIVKQFEDALKLSKAGKPVPVDELPVPPSFPPLQVPSKPAEPPQEPSEMKPKTPPRAQTTRNTGNHVPNNTSEQQMQILLSRQKQFKEAALKAKHKGEINQAKEFLRTAKGFDKLIDAASRGLPVDLSTLPLPPDAKSHLDKEFDLVTAEDCLEDDDSPETDILSRLEHQLQRQLKMCLTTRDHNKSLGDVAGTNRFERLALNVTKDLDIVRLAKKNRSTTVPKFHYEFKDFSIVKSFTELTDNELELSIIRGINYNTDAPKEIDTYVKFTFPWPQETPFTEKSVVVKDTNNPEYNATFNVPINRTARTCQRAFKRHAVKFEVYSKGCCSGASDWLCCFSGWFRSDTLIGVASVKLQNLENRCEIHDSFDLMDGRKKTGGKLEVRLRLRHPIVTQEVEQLHEKWLVIDN